MKTNKQLQKELESFEGTWPGGANLAKLGWKKSVAKSIYLDYERVYEKCIKPYVNPNITVLEIGPGGGGWTLKMLDAGKIICFDALSAKHTGFWERVGKREKIKYFQVKDFNCNDLEDNSIDYIFSHDVFCHISYSGANAYLKNLYPKLKAGSNCFVMVADANKYTDKNGKKKQARVAGVSRFKEVVKDYDGSGAGRWYFYADKFYEDLEAFGYKIINRDMGMDKLSPIIHFTKG